MKKSFVLISIIFLISALMSWFLANIGNFDCGSDCPVVVEARDFLFCLLLVSGVFGIASLIRKIISKK